MMVQYDVKRVTKGAENFMVSFDFAKTPITQVADYIIIAASKSGTSDIHFDPRDEGMMVRFRIDGDCQDYTYIPKAYERNLTTRLKLLANMNITETRLPQDGAIKGQFGDTYLDMRVACLPTNQGEKIVIRILDYTRSLQGIDSLGFHPKNLEKIHHMMGVPNGIILVTGATGSGKSTTTYSMLSALNKPEVNVITVEDPVEMNIEGINQVQVNAEIGMTFAAALRSILREDPNVILIGEIRDSETAQIAVRASITGHLVMSTLHTNNALATVERLLDMDVERYLLSTALTGIISQRLAKQLCQDCKIQREATKYEKKIYKKFLHQDVSLVWDANPKGCDNCRKGYKGRIAVHEVLLLDDKIRNALNDEKMSKDDFAKMIYSGNTISMLQDALIKSLEGQTSFEEVYKTIEIENEDEDNYAAELEGIEIRQVTEEVQEEVKSDEDFMGDDESQKSELAAKYEIPGVTSATEEQPESTEEQSVEATEQQPVEGQPVEVNEQPTEEQTEPPVEETTVQITEAPPIDQNIEISEAPANEQSTETVETSPEEIQPTEVPVEQQVTEVAQEQPEVNVEEVQQPTEQVETLVESTPAEEQNVVESTETTPENTYEIRTTYVEADELQNPEPQQEMVENTTEEGVTEYTTPTPEQTESETQTKETTNVETEYTLPEVSESQIEEQQIENTDEFTMPQVNETPVEEVSEATQTEQTDFEMPQVNFVQPQEFTEETQTEETQVEIPNVNEQPTEEYSETVQQSEDNQAEEQTNLGYKIVMPNEENKDEQVDEQPEQTENQESTETENYETQETETEENTFEMPAVETNTAPTTLDKLVEEVSDESTDDEEDDEEVEKYTISAVKNDQNNNDNNETIDTSLAPIVDEDDEDEEESEDNDNRQYHNPNEIYEEEDPIDLTIDIKTDLDKLVMPKFNLEKLDLTEETEEEHPEEAQEEISDNQEVGENNNNVPEETSETTNETTLEIPSGETTEEQPQYDDTILEIPGASTTEEQQESETQSEQSNTEDNQQEQTDENTANDYEYDYEYDDAYDDYDFDKNNNDYTNEEQVFFNEQTISAVSSVADLEQTEEHTGSSLLTDPGIRIADDGSINQSANINADPILPNYED